MALTPKRSLGNLGEDIAEEFLKKKGYAIKVRNYLKPWGEIDIIAEKEGTYHFIEVKTVSRENSSQFSREMEYRPEELVGQGKLERITRTAATYMEETKEDREYQIDVIGVILDVNRKIARCRFFEQVLE
ncbi:YraN family protein [Candidatus Parcubacteria bacterium]|nr:MAG: YraN family protein [Candidatus Parcubacteria bacterium]